MKNIRTEHEFYEVLGNDESLIFFYARWADCNSASSELESFASSHGKSSIVYSVDVDALPSVTEKMGVTSIPTVLYSVDGNVRNKIYEGNGFCRGATKINFSSLEKLVGLA